LIKLMVLHKADSLHEINVSFQLKRALLVEGVLTSVKYPLCCVCRCFEPLQVMESKSVRVGPIARQCLNLTWLLGLRLDVVGDLFHLHCVRPVSLTF